VPKFKLTPPKETIVVEPSVLGVRPFVVCAVLRNITFTKQSYDSFIDLQEKLHRNICRLRTLASIGTHDLDTIQGPFVYRAEKPEDIKFAPLDNTAVVNGHQLMEQLDKHAQLSKFLHIIRDKPLYPVVRDSKSTVLSLPPIINGDHSKITLNTKNVFIEVTAVDMTKARVVLDTVVTMFSEHCAPQFEIEQVTVVTKSADGGADSTAVYPLHDQPTLTCSVDYINGAIGIKATAEEMVVFCARMGVEAVKTSEKSLSVKIPPTRSDIMHECDVMEDVAIAYGFNKLKKMAPKTVGEGKQLPINKLSDSLRLEIAQAGYLEMLSFILSTKADNYKNLNLPESSCAKEAVELSNPKGNIQICRTSMLPGLFNSLAHNKGAVMPIQIFEIGDVVFRDTTSDVGAINVRQLAAVYQNKKTAGFEEIHGLLDRIMLCLNVDCKGWSKGKPKGREYTIVEASHPTFFPGRCANIVLDGKVIGTFGVVHPTVLENFRLSCPASALIMHLEPFL
jgi:phenylalanyl-tRNA synthetase beta chain